MTREEAISNLKELKMDVGMRTIPLVANIIIESLDMAIKALELVNDFERARIITGGRLNGRTQAYKCGLADGQRQTRWIPVSERLPEDYIHVLCQFTLGGMGECYLAHGVFHVVGGLVMTCNEVIAWLPLPEPYKAESEE